MRVTKYISIWFGYMDVKQTGEWVVVYNVSKIHKILSRFIKSRYKHPKIYNVLFSLSGKHLKFPSFFLVEFVYILKDILTNSKLTYGDRRALTNILELIKENTWMNTVLIDRGESFLDFNKLSSFKYTLMEQQYNFLKAVSNRIPRYKLKGYMLGSPPGTGKAQPLFSKVLTPHGWVKMGDIKVNDYITAYDGSSVKVTDIYPQHSRKTFKITCEDGRFTYADGNHLWEISTKVNSRSYERLDTEDMLDELNQGISLYITKVNGNNEATTYPQKVINEAIALAIAIKQELSKNEKITLQDLKSLCGNVTRLNVCEVLNRPFKVRERFVNTLLSKHFLLFKSQIYKKLPKINSEIKHVLVDIIRSVGGIADSELINIGFPKNIRITKIEPSTVEECQCIAIDHPNHLYVTDNYIVTHNTFMDLAFAECLPNSENLIKIIISPKNAINDIWERHLQEIYVRPLSYWVSSTKGDGIPNDREFYIFHYEQLHVAIEFAQTILKQNKRYMVILDESHNFNVIKSLRSQQIITLCNLVPNIYSIFASGTPFKALGIEMLTCLSCIDPYFTPTVCNLFQKVFGGMLPSETSRLLRERIDLFMFKIPKTDIVDDVLKPIVYKLNVKVDDPTSYTLDAVKNDMSKYIEDALKNYQSKMKEYDLEFMRILDVYEKSLFSREINAFKQYKSIIIKLRKSHTTRNMETNQLLAEAKKYEEIYLLPRLNSSDKKTFKQIRSIIKSLISKVMGEALGRIYQKRRAEASTAIANVFNVGEVVNNAKAKTLVYSSFIETIDCIYEKLKDEGFTPHIVYAKTNNKLLTMINEFNTIEEVNPLVATFKSLSTAVHLVTANTLVMYDVPFRQYLYDQTISRVYRKGQTKQVVIYELYLDTGETPNITTRTNDILSWSRDQIAILIGEDFSGKDMESVLTTID